MEKYILDYIEDCFAWTIKETVFAFHDSCDEYLINIVFLSDLNKPPYLISRDQVINNPEFSENYKYSIAFNEETSEYYFLYMKCTPQTYYEPEFCDMIESDDTYLSLEDVVSALLTHHIEDMIESYNIIYQSYEYDYDQKYIFLDIDGVLATDKMMNMEYGSKDWIGKYNVYPFDKDCIDTFNIIINECGINKVKIVLSSDWRLFHNIDELFDIFQINGISFKKENFDITNEHIELTRSCSIKEYLNANKHIKNYVVIDDINMKEVFYDKFIHCDDVRLGLAKEGLKEKIINKLNKK